MTLQTKLQYVPFLIITRSIQYDMQTFNMYLTCNMYPALSGLVYCTTSN